MIRNLRHLLIPLILVAYEIAVYLSNDMYLPALPKMMQDLNISMQQVQLTLSMWFVGSMCAPLFMGALTDRFGRRPILLGGGLIYAVSCILCTFTTQFEWFLVYRIIQGAMVAAMLVPGYACIHELYDQHEAIKLLALMGAIVIVAPALGPLLGSVILLVTSWHGIFWFIALSTLIVLALLYYYLPETQTPDKRKPIHLGTLFNEYLTTLRAPAFLMYSLIIGFTFAGFLAWVTASPLLIIVSFKLSPVVFGIAQAIVFFLYILGTRKVKSLLDQHGAQAPIKVGITISLIGGILMLLDALIFPENLWTFLITMCAYAYGSGLAFSALNRLAIEGASTPMGVRVALFTAIVMGFATLGSALVSEFYTGTILSLASIITIAAIATAILYTYCINFMKDAN